MYYRRKIALALLETFGNQLEKLKLQKLLMLFCNEQEKPAFYFVPYKYGCFSFQANADLTTLIKYGEVEEKENSWCKISKTSYAQSLKDEDFYLLKKLLRLYGNKTAEELIYHTYTQHPYYAIKSTIAKRHLNKIELAAVTAKKSIVHTTGLFTIGYEGISLEQYLNKLLVYDIKVLCDVRRNAFSMKYGFSKSQLKNACAGLGILYVHIPEVGIAANQRRSLENQADYDILFEEYKANTLNETSKQQLEIINLIDKHHRVAITCFEADVCQCHRKPLAEAISKLPSFTFTMQHI